MQYELYENKIKKVAEVLALILRHIVLVITVLALIIGSIVAILALKGSVISVDAPTSVVYGESMVCKGKAFLSRVTFEYLGDDGQWSETPPVMTGEYKLRARGKGSFGTYKYGDELAFGITPAPLSVTVAENELEYGSVPSAHGRTVRGDTISCESFTFEKYQAITATAKNQKAVATNTVTPNIGAIRIFNSNGADVTRAYDISVESKEIGILPRSITVTVEDKEKTYDGVELKWDGWELTDGELVGDDKLLAIFSTSVTDVGEAYNTPELVVSDKNGEKINFCYNINLVEGKLSVTARQLLMSSKGNEFLYDGKAHSCKEYSIDEGDLVGGHRIVLQTSAEVTNVSSTPVLNTMTFDILNGEGKSVYKNYSIMLDSGELKILPRALSVSFSDDSFVYDAKVHTYGKQYVFDSNSVTLVEKALPADFDGLECIDAGSYTTNDAPILVKSNSGEDISYNFDIKVERHGTITITKKPISISTNDYIVEYSEGTDNALWKDSVYLSNGDLCGGHHIDPSMLDEDAKIDVGKYVNNAAVKILAGTIDVTDNYLISDGRWGSFEVYPREVTVTVYDASKVYDDTPLTSSGYKTDRLVTNHKLTAQIVGTITEVKENGTVWSDIDRDTIVITNKQQKNVTYNYTVNVIRGELEIIPKDITVTTASGTKMYDADPFEKHELHSSVNSYLVSGHRIECTFSSEASISEIPLDEESGTVFNSLIQSKTKIIRNSDGKEVQDNYRISYVDGTLTLTKRTITVKSASNTWEYDGDEHNDNGYEITSSTKLVGGSHNHSIDKDNIVSEVCINAGEYDNKFYQITIVNYRGKDVSHNYDITVDEGKLTVTKRVIVVTTGSDSKIYDGTPLWSDEISADRLVAGHKITPYGPNSIINVKESKPENNTCTSIEIYNGYEDVTRNYQVEKYNYGTLEIFPCEVTITTGSVTRLYDPKVPISSDRGTVEPLYAMDLPLRVYAKLSGNTIHSGKGIVANYCDVTKTKIISEETGQEIDLDNFIISGNYIWGELNAIDEEKDGIVYLRVAIYPKSKIYTGSTFNMRIEDFDPEILNQGRYSINYDGLSISMKEFGTFTLGELNNLALEYNIRVTSLDGTGSGKTYKVIFVTPMGTQDESYSVFSITRKSITLTAASADLTYKADTILRCNDMDITKGSLVDGHTIKYVCDGEIDCSTSVKNGYEVVNNVADWRIYDEYNNDVTYNYEVATKPGKLTLIK